MRVLFAISALILAGAVYSFVSKEKVTKVATNAQVDKASVVAPNEESIEYFIEVRVSPVGRYQAEFKVSTNIPLPVEVMAGISIKGQNPSDVYIGTSRRITLNASTETFIIDGTSDQLPSGDYLAEVTFYPRWGADNGSPDAANIDKEITGAAEVKLMGSGESKSDVDLRNILQVWVMENVAVGSSWSEATFTSRLGVYEKYPAELSHHDAYYFPQADMTMIVSRVENAVAVWRMGKAFR